MIDLSVTVTCLSQATQEETEVHAGIPTRLRELELEFEFEPGFEVSNLCMLWGSVGIVVT